MSNNSEKQSKSTTYFTLKTKNVGPLEDETFKLVIPNENKLKGFCIYAYNGSGKTFTSRCFSLSETLNNNQDQDREDLYKQLIKFDKSDFEFDFSLDSDPTKRIHIKCNQQQILENTNKTDFIFYVFNIDFIRKNIYENIADLNSSVEGYITVGNEDIQIEKLNEQISDLNNEKERIHSKIDEKIGNWLQEIKKECDISSKTNEYKNITFETIINLNKQSIHDQYETYKTQYKTLKTFPSNIDNILPIKKEFYIKNFQNFENLFQKEYTLNNFSKEFRDKIQGKFEFVKSGTELLNQNNKLNCPFCEQEMNDNAIKLIDEYNKFLHDEQTTIIEELKSFSNELKNIKELYPNFLLDCSKTENLIIEISNYFPSLKNKKFFKFENKEDLDTIIDNLLQLTNKKRNNISESIDIHEDITKLNNFSKDFENIINKNNSLIEEINESVSKKDKEKLTIKKNICLAVINKVVDESKELIKQYNVITNKINDLNANIKELEQTCKKSKKDFILEHFEKLLKVFFANKYQFDKNTSKFKFLEHDITNNTNYVFSEGEKNIIAFCYYLAFVYNVVQNEKDLDKVFYIIDDPISSVDYLYIYKIAQIIKEDKHIKHKLILTHSLEFVNVLSKQKVVNFFILLNKGKFYQMSSRIYPYFNHLFDIYNISINANEPTHTTLNSIRNILESIISFVSPKTNLDEFIKKQIPGFDETPELCLLINHFSHGIISENEEVYTNEQIKIICKKLIEYINCVFPGQIEMLENMRKS